MIISLLVGLFIFCCLLLGILVMIQQGKGDMGLGALHSGTQTLFGGSGGQTFFQKLTWVFGAIFLTGSLGLTVLKMQQLDSTRIVVSQQAASNPVAPAAEADAE
ncbi:MAG: preprotein translocase subunit SecG [Candidatus Dependentiae bacterium]|nr:preprotein translocase subunit SecG [Candidatus Dependentiae bacterium]